ncbi:hypothetical protein [Streptomyces litchfieldiae]|uniref:Uncharacterized protein n=1 Tax=Streptomyces litchfieldiae TaxID=3075543 RepID=A0ABU2MUH3_9ACTN|nr:hypothetical protein [Streptomyces sp. DSM 44938]MDT0345057.1 hypothetical protein [Streptomyces sp. DSM 44938]
MTSDSIADTIRDGQIPARADSVGPGWGALLDELHRRLHAIAPTYQLDGFDTQFGGLRVFVADRFDADGEFDGYWADAAAEAIAAAEAASRRTCASCGEPGRLRFRGRDRGPGLLLVVLCDACGLGPLRHEEVDPARGHRSPLPG